MKPTDEKNTDGEALPDDAEARREKVLAFSHRLMTVPEVRVALRLINDAAVRTMIRVGKLPAVKVGRRLMVARVHVETLISELEARPVRVPRGGGLAVETLDAAVRTGRMDSSRPRISNRPRAEDEGDIKTTTAGPIDGRYAARLRETDSWDHVAPCDAGDCFDPACLRADAAARASSDSARIAAGSPVSATPALFPSAPLLHGAHTLFACAAARGAPPAVDGPPEAPPAVDAICTFTTCPMAAPTMNSPAGLALSPEKREEWGSAIAASAPTGTPEAIGPHVHVCSPKCEEPGEHAGPGPLKAQTGSRAGALAVLAMVAAVAAPSFDHLLPGERIDFPPPRRRRRDS